MAEQPSLLFTPVRGQVLSPFGGLGSDDGSALLPPRTGGLSTPGAQERHAPRPTPAERARQGAATCRTLERAAAGCVAACTRTLCG